MIREDLQAVLERDPSAGSRIEVILTNPGFHAVLFHRLCHVLWRWGLRLLPRWVAMLGRFITGVEIHPAVRIGRRFFIDHGAGVVIGETARIGDDVTLYHQVTLGGIAPALNSARQAQQKRHPTIKDGVIIGSGAQILGPVTVGAHARVGANAVVLQDVAPQSTVVGVPAKKVTRDAACQAKSFVAYGTPLGDMPDPTARAVETMIAEIAALNKRLNQLEKPQQREKKTKATRPTARPSPRKKTAKK